MIKRCNPHIGRSRGLTLGILVLLIMLLTGIIWPADLSAENNQSEVRAYVVLLHGLGRSHWAMWSLQNKLSKQGFEVINLSYPSTKYTVEDLAKFIGKNIEQRCTDPYKPVHFVTHSLGGIVLRYYLSGHPPINIGRIVMLAPPNHGSELADIVQRSPLLNYIGASAIRQLGTCDECFTNQLGPVDGEVGVITGDRSIHPLFSRLIPGEDDGTVSVSSAKVMGMKDFLVVHHSHTFIMNSPDVINQVINFLKQGKFTAT